ncbi:hypothetical protein HYX04_00245 [Candidatus Woesearchaeota archaeon]|nr:hypothetical protein [Candidatus Woesearchaeota archaeon]
MLRKTNLLVTALFSILFLLIVNAAEETANESVNAGNDTLSLDSLNSAISNEAKASIVMPEQNHIIEDSRNNDKKEGKAATASFGVYLNIAG